MPIAPYEKSPQMHALYEVQNLAAVDSSQQDLESHGSEDEIKQLKVLLVAHIGYPWGGVSQRYSDLLGSSFSKKIDLTFFESSPNKKSISSTGLLNLQNVLGGFEVCAKYVAELIRTRPSIVHIASSFGYSFLKGSILIIIAKLWGCKVILAPHCSISVFIPKPKALFLWMKFVLNLCDGLIVLSEEWLAIQQIVAYPRVRLLRNSIKLENYLKLNRTAEGPKEDVRIVYLGHIGADKGILDLIQAVNALQTMGAKGFRVFIYGEEIRPGELDHAKKLTRKLDLDHVLFFCEPVFDDKKVEVLRDADIFVLPSHHEGLPISVIEAMAAGLPVIGTRVGGIPDLVVDSESGTLVDPNSPLCLAGAMMNLIESKALRYLFGMTGRRRACENHDVENYVERLIKFYQEVL